MKKTAMMSMMMRMCNMCMRLRVQTSMGFQIDG